MFMKDPLIKPPGKFSICDKFYVILFSKNIIILDPQHNPIIPTRPVSIHLRNGQFKEALECLDLVTSEKEFTRGFVECCRYLMQNVDCSYIQDLETMRSKYANNRISETKSKLMLVRLGYALLENKHFDTTFVLAKKIASLKLLNDLAFYAEKEGFKGIAMLAKHERERYDENYLNPKQELETIIQSIGKTMTSNDYTHMLSDFEEILSISKISEAQSKGGYLEEKNFWDIDLEEYAQALILESEGRYTEALEIFTQNSLTQDIYRIQSLMNEKAKPLCPTETNISSNVMNSS